MDGNGVWRFLRAAKDKEGWKGTVALSAVVLRRPSRFRGRDEVFQWCCSTPQGSPGVGRKTFLSSPHLCFIIVFICDLFVSRDDPLMS